MTNKLYDKDITDFEAHKIVMKREKTKYKAYYCNDCDTTFFALRTDSKVFCSCGSNNITGDYNG